MSAPHSTRNRAIPSSRRSRSSSRLQRPAALRATVVEQVPRTPGARPTAQERLDRLDERMNGTPGALQTSPDEPCVPQVAALAASSASSRLLPMPGSPDTNVTRPRPAAASARWSSSVANSRSRPKHDSGLPEPVGAGGRSRRSTASRRCNAGPGRGSPLPDAAPRPGATPSSSASNTRSRRQAPTPHPAARAGRARSSAAPTAAPAALRGDQLLALRHGVAVTARGKIAAIRSSAIDARSSSSPAASVRANGRSANPRAPDPARARGLVEHGDRGSVLAPLGQPPGVGTSAAPAASVVSPSSA